MVGVVLVQAIVLYVGYGWLEAFVRRAVGSYTRRR